MTMTTSRTRRRRTVDHGRSLFILWLVVLVSWPAKAFLTPLSLRAQHAAGTNMHLPPPPIPRQSLHQPLVAYEPPFFRRHEETRLFGIRSKIVSFFRRRRREEPETMSSSSTSIVESEPLPLAFMPITTAADSTREPKETQEMETTSRFDGMIHVEAPSVVKAEASQDSEKMVVPTMDTKQHFQEVASSFRRNEASLDAEESLQERLQRIKAGKLTHEEKKSLVAAALSTGNRVEQRLPLHRPKHSAPRSRSYPHASYAGTTTTPKQPNLWGVTLKSAQADLPPSPQTVVNNGTTKAESEQRKQSHHSLANHADNTKQQAAAAAALKEEKKAEDQRMTMLLLAQEEYWARKMEAEQSVSERKKPQEEQAKSPERQATTSSVRNGSFLPPSATKLLDMDGNDVSPAVQGFGPTSDQDRASEKNGISMHLPLDEKTSKDDSDVVVTNNEDNNSNSQDESSKQRIRMKLPLDDTGSSNYGGASTTSHVPQSESQIRMKLPLEDKQDLSGETSPSSSKTSNSQQQEPQQPPKRRIRMELPIFDEEEMNTPPKRRIRMRLPLEDGEKNNHDEDDEEDVETLTIADVMDRTTRNGSTDPIERSKKWGVDMSRILN